MPRTRLGFPGSQRLRSSAEFATTLKSRWRWRGEFFNIYAHANPYLDARLGMIVSRKTSPRAVVRNRIKRQIRETFRLRQEHLKALDIVVAANPKAGTAALTDLRTALESMWKQVENECKRS